MASSWKLISLAINTIFTLLASSSPLTTTEEQTPIPTPTPWPEQFHSIIFSNKSDKLQLVDLWYDWPNGRNFNIFRDQLSNNHFYSLEWNNGTSFFYDDSGDRQCSSLQVEVGLVRPNWMEGGNYLGQRLYDGFVCNVWEKGQIEYYAEDVITHRPVHWFDNGRLIHIMTFEVGAVLEDEKWQVPSYCFETDKLNEISENSTNI